MQLTFQNKNSFLTVFFQIFLFKKGTDLVANHLFAYISVYVKHPNLRIESMFTNTHSRHD